MLAAGECAQDEAKSHPVLLHNEERRSWLQPWKAPAQGLRTPVCSMALPPARRKGWPGPRIHLSLPSFSGGTPDCPDLLQYTCQLVTNVRAVAPARVQVRPPLRFAQASLLLAEDSWRSSPNYIDISLTGFEYH